MLKQQWKVLSFFLVSLLIAFVSLVSVSPLLSKSFAQTTSEFQCGGLQSTDQVSQAMQSLIERYGIDVADVCSTNQFRQDYPEVRADMADWLAKGFQRVAELIAAATADLMSKEQLNALEQIYNEVLTEVEALEQTRH